MSSEVVTAIVFGVLQVGIGLVALWQQRRAQAQPQPQARQLQRTSTPPSKLGGLL